MTMQNFKDYIAKIREQVKAVWSRLVEQCRPVCEKIQTQACRYLTTPLSEDEYAMLKRVSAIIGTAVALYLIATSGLKTVLVVTGLCLVLAVVLQKITRCGRSVVKVVA